MRTNIFERTVIARWLNHQVPNIRRCLGHEDGVLMSVIRALIIQTDPSSLSPREDTARRWLAVNQEVDWICQGLDRGLSLQNCEECISVVYKQTRNYLNQNAKNYSSKYGGISEIQHSVKKATVEDHIQYMMGVTIFPDMPRIFLAYVCCPPVIINSNPYVLKSVSAWMINYIVILNMINFY